MIKYNFLPLSYRKTILKRDKFKFILNIIILCLCIVILGGKAYSNYRKVQNLDMKICSIKKITRIKNKNKSKSNKNMDTIKSLKNTMYYIKDKKNLYSAKIEENKIYVKGNYYNKKDMKSFIENIEKSKKFKIKNLRVGREGKKIKLEMWLEV